MYRCFLTNFGWYLQGGDSDTLEGAIAYGKSKGYEFSVWKTPPVQQSLDASFVQMDDELVASWSPIGGLRTGY